MLCFVFGKFLYLSWMFLILSFKVRDIDIFLLEIFDRFTSFFRVIFNSIGETGKFRQQIILSWKHLTFVVLCCLCPTSYCHFVVSDIVTMGLKEGVCVLCCCKKEGTPCS
jgi:hypothetical protein